MYFDTRVDYLLIENCITFFYISAEITADEFWKTEKYYEKIGLTVIYFETYF